jgi:ribonucleotide monophosphatase NagD (HAD superfamily)
MTADYLRTQYSGATCFVVGGADSAEDFEGIELGREGAEVVVIGGASWALSYDDMNTALRLVLDGAALIGMHSTFSWMTDEGMVLDSGVVLLRGLEAATGRTAVVCGKPAQQAFVAGLHSLDLPAERVAMVGDDVNTDVLAAQASGLTGVLVRTGKFRQDMLEMAGGHPDLVIDSIVNLPDLLTG